MDPRYTPGSDRNSRAALFSNYVSCPKRVRMIKGSMMMALQKLPTLLMATFKLAEREMFSDRNKTASEMHVEPRIVAHCCPLLPIVGGQAEVGLCLSVTALYYHKLHLWQSFYPPA